jgi:hypothetical protein
MTYLSGVMAERKIRRLNAQVKEQQTKKLSGKPKKWCENDTDRDIDDDNFFLFSEMMETQVRDEFQRGVRKQETAWPHTNMCEACKLQKNTSMISLYSSTKGSNKTSTKSSRQNLISSPDDSITKSFASKNASKQQHHQVFPSEEYLRGALWFGRNLSMIVERMVEGLDAVRTKFLKDILAASQDDDKSRASQRLNLISGAGITEIISIVYENRLKIRNFLQV